MTYEEFRDSIEVDCSTWFVDHSLAKVHMRFEMSCDADYTDEKKREMSEDEFIEYVARKFYEIIVDDKQHDWKDCDD